MTTALVLAIVGVVLSVASLTWQLATFLLTASRVRAHLRHGGVGRGGISFGPPGTFMGGRLAEQGFSKELIGVEVFNRGRVGVNITSWRIQAGRESYRPVGDQLGPQLPHRLEPGASASWFAPMETVRRVVATSAEVLDGPNPASVRGFVQLGTGGLVKTKGTMSVRG
jgi:hypothetical protein